ncbi:hypothetical protein JMJ35_001695 [Cladonia borealis]|uniref:Uncharacterized protein n=1 Tax=Cladonia borealis TaxID=184061 RepID=A0AA39R8Z0_9LECA|nr:hypothetical protein JMJ35_001695 [Cladonia borealis]
MSPSPPTVRTPPRLTPQPRLLSHLPPPVNPHITSLHNQAYITDTVLRIQLARHNRKLQPPSLNHFHNSTYNIPSNMHHATIRRSHMEAFKPKRVA